MVVFSCFFCDGYEYVGKLIVIFGVVFCVEYLIGLLGCIVGEIMVFFIDIVFFEEE